MWGVKTQLKIVFSNDLVDTLYKLDGSVIGSATLALNTIELRIPYIKLENQKQLELWTQMYSNTINKYWLDVDQYFTQSVVNTEKTDNETFRVTVKGLNNRPRWLLLHAVDTSSTALNDAKHMALGFGGDGTSKSMEVAKDTQNSLRMKKIRIRLNGIYIDGGDVKEFENVNAVGTADTDGDAIQVVGKITKDIWNPTKNIVVSSVNTMTKEVQSNHSTNGLPSNCMCLTSRILMLSLSLTIVGMLLLWKLNSQLTLVPVQPTLRSNLLPTFCTTSN